jgi:O-antigen/teichoic acid export membrane protein
MIFQILRNIISLLTGHIVAKLFSLACVIFLARRLGVKGFGMYGTVMAYLTLFATFADSGTSTVTVREVAQTHTRSDAYFSHVLTLKLLLTAGAYGIMVLIGSIWHSSDYSLLFIASCGVFLFPEAIRRLGAAMLSAYERMDIVAVLDVLAVVFRYIPFLVAVLSGASLYVAFLLLIVSWTCIAGIWLIITRKYCLQQRIFPVRSHLLWDILYESFPFGILSVLSMIYFKADIIMLSKMKGSTAVGFYEGAYKFIEASMFVPISIVNVLLPVMSRSFVADKTSYHRLYIHATRILAMSILPVVIFVAFFSKEIILFVYGATYLPSASALSVLIWALFLMFINAPVGNIIATSKTMHAFLPYAIGNTLLNILLNFLLIPKYSFLGASLTTALTECTGFVIQLYFANRVLGNTSDVLRIIAKLLAAGIVTSVVLYVTKFFVIFPFRVLILVSVYIACLFAFNVIKREDKQLYTEIIRIAKAKFSFRD